MLAPPESKLSSVSGPSFPDRDVKLTADGLYIAKLGSNRFIGVSLSRTHQLASRHEGERKWCLLVLIQ
jgi:hypothetical protein